MPNGSLENWSETNMPPQGVNDQNARNLYFILQVLNVFKDVNTRDLKETYDKFMTATAIAGVDIKLDVEKIMSDEKRREEALNNLVKEGLVVFDKAERTYRIADYRQQEYYDCIYEAKFNEMNARMCSRMSGILWKVLAPDALKRLKKALPILKNNSLVKAGAEKITGDDETIAKLRALTFNRAADVFNSYVLADKLIRPDEPEIGREMVSPSMKAKTGHVHMMGVASVINGFRSFAGYLLVMGRLNVFQIEEARRQERGKIHFIEKLFPKTEHVIDRGLHAIDNFLKAGSNLEFVNIRQSEMNRVEMQIIDANKVQYQSSMRGMSFAQIMSTTNVFRCGRSEYIPGWCRAMHLTKMDTAWALVMMTCGMKADISGIKYEPKSLDRRPEKMMKPFYALQKDPKRFDQELKKLENKFVETRNALLSEVTVKREEGHLPSLDPQIHFNPIFDNSKPDPKHPEEPFLFQDIGFSDWQSKNFDVEKFFEKKNCLVVHFKDTITALFKHEDKSIAGLLSASGHTVDVMPYFNELTHLSNNWKRECGKIVKDNAYGLEISALSTLCERQDRKSTNKEETEHNIQLKALLKQLLKDGYTIDMNEQTKQYIVKEPSGDLCFKFSTKENLNSWDTQMPNEMFRYVGTVRSDLECNVMKALGLDAAQQERMDYIYQTIHNNPDLKYFCSEQTERAEQFQNLQCDINQVSTQSLLNLSERDIVTQSLIGKHHIESVSDKEFKTFQDDIEHIKQEISHDRLLGLCKTVDQSFVREEDGQIIGSIEGIKVTVSHQGQIIPEHIGNADQLKILGQLADVLQNRLLANTPDRTDHWER